MIVRNTYFNPKKINPYILLTNGGKYVFDTLRTYVYVRWCQKFGILKATVSGVFEDLKFKISEDSDQN